MQTAADRRLALDAIGLSHETAFAQLDVHNPSMMGR